MAATWTHAHHNLLKKVIHISIAENGGKCNCICVECNEPLEAVQGSERDPHFRHIVNKGCNGGLESILHLRAKQFLCGHDSLLTPGREIIYTSPVVEKAFAKYRPDVTFYVNGLRWFIEVIVTNHISEEKHRYYLDTAAKVLVIDLCGIAYDISDDDLKQLLFKEPANKSFIEPEFAMAPPSPLATVNAGKLLVQIFAAAGAFLLFLLLIPRVSRLKK